MPRATPAPAFNRHPSMNIHMRPGEFDSSHSTTAAHAPTAEAAEIIARTAEIHIRNGNWALAHNVLNCAERDFNLALARHRTPQDWLDGSLLEFKLPVRVENIFLALDITTMRAALEFLNTGPVVEQLGPTQSEAVWRAAAGKGIDFPRSELATLIAVKERQRREHIARTTARKQAEKRGKRTPAELAKSRRRRFHQPVEFVGSDS